MTMKNTVLKKNPVPCVVLLSGSGSNAEALLKFERTTQDCPYHITALVTDAPESSRAREIAAAAGVDLVEYDIRKFYLEHGEESIKLDTPRRKELREEWSEELYARIAPFGPEFACFAGFVPLSNIARHLPCLNVHPGDLTRCGSNGERLFAGLHVLPAERAILCGEAALRSSVILVQPYTGNGSKEMDAGPVLGVSEPLPIELEGETPETLAALKARRVPGVPVQDSLRRLALEHIERLKVAGDHVVFPRAAADFAAGKFKNVDDKLYYCGTEVLTVEYSAVSAPRMLFKS